MAMTMTNTSEKVIGVGSVTVLPGETKEVPLAFETSPILEVYKKMGLMTIVGEPTKTVKQTAAKQTKAENAAADRQAKLSALKAASDEGVAAMAKELGVNPADCKDQADVRKKVKAALSK